MKITFFVALFIWANSLNVFAQSKITKEEYLIYATVINLIYASNSENNNESSTELPFVILDTTFLPDDFNFWKVDKIRGLLSDFRQKNRAPAKLEKSFPIPYRYEIADKREIDRLLEIGKREFDIAQKKRKEERKPLMTWGAQEIWKHFHTKYANSNGYYQFSGVGLSRGKEFAFVIVKHEASSNGSENYFILRKKKGRWTHYLSSSSNWIS